MATKKTSVSKVRARPAAAKPTAKVPKKHKTATSAPRKNSNANTLAVTYASQITLLVIIFTLLSAIFAVMAFWRYG